MPVCVVLSLIKEKENESAWYNEKAKERGLSLFPSSASPSLFFHYCLVFFIGIPRGSLCGGERFITFLVSDEPEKNANKGEGKGQPRDRGEREIEI